MMRQHNLMSTIGGLIAVLIITDIYTMAYIERGTPYDKLNLTPKQKVPDSIRIENETNERKDLMDWLIDMNHKKKYTTKIHNNRNKKKSKRRVLRRNKDIGIYTVMTSPTNRLKVYLAAKTGLYLKMDVNGRLGGTNDIKNPDSVFIIESMERSVVRLKGERCGKYICINKARRLVTRGQPLKKCLLRTYLEENDYGLFWSHKFSPSRDGENGWFLALKKNGRIKQPMKTRIGDASTMFHVHILGDT